MTDTIPHDKWFYFKHGRRASNIKELKEILENIDEGEFKHHVNNQKNDFANWVEDVFGEEKLAHNMREVNDKEGIIIILDDFLNSQREGIPAPLESPEPPPPPEHVAHHRHHKKAGVPVPEEPQISLEPEKELSEKEIKNIVDEAMQVFEKREKKKDEKEEKESKEEKREEAEELDEVEEDEEAWEKKFKTKLDSEKSSSEKQEKHEKEHHKFIVEEFLYGFILGLIFGLIMLGVILHLNIA